MTGPAAVVAAIAALVAVAAGLIDLRVRRRHDLDRVGLLDWRTMQFLALGVAIIAGAVVLH